MKWKINVCNLNIYWTRCYKYSQTLKNIFLTKREMSFMSMCVYIRWIDFNDVKQNPNVGFLGLAVCLRVSTPLFLLTSGHGGHFTGCTKNPFKNNKQEDGRKKHGFRTENAGKWSWHFSILYSWPLRELSENPTQLQNIQTHLFIVFIASCLDSMLRSLTPNWSPRSLTPDWLTLCSRVSLPTDWRPLSLFYCLTGFCRHSSLCGLCANIDKERCSGHSGAASRMPEIRSPLWPTNTPRPTHIHPYIYIYIYISSSSTDLPDPLPPPLSIVHHFR